MADAIDPREAEWRRKLNELPPRLKAMSLNDPLVSALVQHYARNDIMTYEDLLEQLLFHVYEDKEKLLQAAIKQDLVTPRPIVIQFPT